MNRNRHVLLVATLIAAVSGGLALVLARPRPGIPVRSEQPSLSSSGEPTTPDAVRGADTTALLSLLREVESSDHAARRVAWRTLGEFAQGVPAQYFERRLAEELDQRSVNAELVRLILIAGFGNLGNQGVISRAPEAMRKCLAHDSKQVRQYALEALRFIPDSSLQSAALDALQDRELFDAALRALPTVWDGTDKAPIELLGLLSRSSDVMRWRKVLKSLSEMPCPAVVHHLEEIDPARHLDEESALSLTDDWMKAHSASAFVEEDPLLVVHQFVDEPSHMQDLALLARTLRRLRGLRREELERWARSDPDSLETHVRIQITYALDIIGIPLTESEKAFLRDTVLLH